MIELRDPDNTILMQLKGGTTVIELLPAIAPNHVERMKALTRSGVYDNVCFHRVIAGFMAQTGDVETGNVTKNYNLELAGTGSSRLPNLKAEFSNVAHDRGTVAAARSNRPDSANSQFFINFSDNHFLNRNYTVFGRVVEGMDYVDMLACGEPPRTPDYIVEMKVAADV